MKNSIKKGYTLIELMVAVGLFALIMLLASGAYLMMISLTRHSQGIATGINNLSFALETMTRNIRTGTAYDCGAATDCVASSFSFKNASGVTVSYSLAGDGSIQETLGGSTRILTDPFVNISSLTFYTIGTKKLSQGDLIQPHVTMVVSGTVTYAAGKTESFTIQTGATMRGSDL